VNVGSGGFGPGYGLLGVGSAHEGESENIVDAWSSFALDRRTLLPLCTWVCAIYSFIDCGDKGQIWGWDPNPDDEDTTPLFRQGYRIAPCSGAERRRESAAEVDRVLGLRTLA